jgi:hypothetical protein
VGRVARRKNPQKDASRRHYPKENANGWEAGILSESLENPGPFSRFGFKRRPLKQLALSWPFVLFRPFTGFFVV